MIRGLSTDCRSHRRRGGEQQLDVESFLAGLLTAMRLMNHRRAVHPRKMDLDQHGLPASVDPSPYMYVLVVGRWYTIYIWFSSSFNPGRSGRGLQMQRAEIVVAEPPMWTFHRPALALPRALVGLALSLPKVGLGREGGWHHRAENG